VLLLGGQLDEIKEQLTAATAAAAEGARWRSEAEAAREKAATQSATAARLEEQLRHIEGELDAALGKYSPSPMLFTFPFESSFCLLLYAASVTHCVAMLTLQLLRIVMIGFFVHCGLPRITPQNVYQASSHLLQIVQSSLPHSYVHVLGGS
jgi:hypothetical protein